MRQAVPRQLIRATTLAALLTASTAYGQNDINRPAPNVMLLVDSSGSMEYKSSGATLPKCFPDESNTDDHEKSRWIELIEVLTGTIQGYSCWAQDRSTSAFRDEFELGTVAPYDANGRYSLPYNRPQSSLCTPGPGVLPSSTNAYEFPAGAIAYRPYSTGSNAVDTGNTCASFSQANDGLLDSLNQQIRFGLMTFDTHPDPGTGVASGIPNYSTGTEGTWSYFMNTVCPVVGTPISTNYCAGTPVDCTTGPFAMEVGARNAAAPPWEGRMVAFGPSSATGSELAQRNGWIQEILLATRPYGATPVAGLMHDAQDFFWNDDSTDPLDTTSPFDDFGPRSDPLLGENCRKNFMILLSDGEPNLDMRPDCVGATCPFLEPAEIADALITDPTIARRVRTYVVGFAVHEVDPEGDGSFVECEELNSTTYCSNQAYRDASPALEACCTLNEIALMGTPPTERGMPDVVDHALFAENPTELRAALSRIFSEALSAVTARTTPVFTSSTGTGTDNRAFQFFSAVDVRTIDLWRGVLHRKRFTCEAPSPGAPPEAKEEDFSEAAGDDFIANVNSDPDGRRFYTVAPALDGSVKHAERSIRPHIGITDPDGLGTYGGTQSANLNRTDLATSAVDDLTIRVDDNTCDSATEDLSASQCKDRYMKWLVGLDNQTDFSRCPNAAQCNLVADIFHSTPQIRGRPDEFLRDDSYAAFAASLNERDTVLYTSSNDGLFHAFKVAPGSPSESEIDSKQNNEMWAFLPPAVIPSIPSMYPNAHQLLLDGRPVLKDVVATGTAFPYALERALSEAIEGSLGNSTWRTVMVQSFGASRGGYYALDVTRPEFSASNNQSGPKFLWQLTQDDTGAEIFGRTAAAPLITTVFIDTGAGTDPVREVAVAVLPGGDDGTVSGTGCAAGPTPLTDADPATFNPAATVNCYTNASAAARSLTIVRLDTGEVVRTFRPPASTVAQPAGFDSTVVTEVAIPAPIVGEPAAYPAQTGLVADRIFVGDKDGRLWRVDVSDTDPANWEMTVFFDAFSNPVGTPPRQPIQTAPVLSVDDEGNITINVSTGDQNVFTETAGVENYVYSLTEILDSTTVEARVNWRHVFEDGALVAGPMTLFDRQLFFATFDPATGECETGSSTVYGINYVEPKLTGDTNIDEGGKPELPDGSGGFLQNLAPVDGVAFGVGIRQLPSCLDDSGPSESDPYLGYGTATTTSFARPGRFELVIQQGGATGGGSAQPLVTQTIALQNPRIPVQVETWAPILE